MPHICRCAICGTEMSPMFVQTQTVGHTGKVEYTQSQHAIKHETYRVVADSETEVQP